MVREVYTGDLEFLFLKLGGGYISIILFFFVFFVCLKDFIINRHVVDLKFIARSQMCRNITLFFIIEHKLLMNISAWQ